MRKFVAKAAPKKPVAKPSAKMVRPQPEAAADIVIERGPETFTVPTSTEEPLVLVEEAQDVHVVPEHDFAHRAHDLVRGCWCQPLISGNEVSHR